MDKLIRAKSLYNECKEVINFKYTEIIELAIAADSEEEKAFYYLVSDFFMQQGQKEILKNEKSYYGK